MLVILISCSDRSTLSEVEIVTRKAEFFEYDRLAIYFRYLKMSVDIFVRIRDSLVEIGLERSLAHPAPVIWPDMYVHIVDVRAGVDLFEKRHVVFTSPRAFASRRNHMVRVDRLDERGSAPHPVNEKLLIYRICGEASRFIADLP